MTDEFDIVLNRTDIELEGSHAEEKEKENMESPIIDPGIVLGPKPLPDLEEDEEDEEPTPTEISAIFKDIQLTPSLKKFCKMMRRRLRKDWDAVIGIEGPDPGVGKTCLNISLGYGIDPESFNLATNVFYLSGSLSAASHTIEKQFNGLNKYSYFAIDEGEDALYKLQWFNVLQQSLNLLYMKERKQNKATGICIPRFMDFNEMFRNYRIKYRIYVIDRGIAVAYLRDSDKDVMDPWHVRENEIIKKKFFRGKPIAERTVQDRLEAERRTLNYWFDFTFNDLPAEVWEEYRRVRALHKSETPLNERFNTNELRWKNGVFRLYDYLTKNVDKMIGPDGKPIAINQNKLAEIVGITSATVCRGLRIYRNRGQIPGIPAQEEEPEEID